MISSRFSSLEAPESLRSRLIEAVEQLDTSEPSNLTGLLAQIQSIGVFPTTHPVFSERLWCRADVEAGAAVAGI